MYKKCISFPLHIVSHYNLFKNLIFVRRKQMKQLRLIDMYYFAISWISKMNVAYCIVKCFGKSILLYFIYKKLVTFKLFQIDKKTTL